MKSAEGKIVSGENVSPALKASSKILWKLFIISCCNDTEHITNTCSVQLLWIGAVFRCYGYVMFRLTEAIPERFRRFGGEYVRY